MAKTVLITGASSGFGKDAALLFARNGWNVAASMRSPERSATWAADLFTPQLDVTDSASMQAAVAATVERYGRIDVLVNNAGFALMGPLEGASREDLQREIDTNLMGTIQMTQLVLPIMRAAREGVIVNLSSVGGRLTFPLFSSYHATKYAIEGLTEALQYELQGHGVRVKLVEPGGSRTDFGGRSLVRTPHPAYEALTLGYDRTWERMAARLPGPEKVARAIYRASTDGGARLRYPVLAFPMLPVRTLVGARGWSAIMKAVTHRLR